MDIKARAKQLADALAESPEYQRLKQAREDIDQHQAAKVMLRDFRKKQFELQKQQFEGNEVTETQTEELSKLYEVLNINPYIRELLEAELAFHNIMMEIQETLSKAIDLSSDLFDDEDESTDENQQQEADPIQEATKKLWTPGN